VRTDGIAEARVVVPPLEAVRACLLAVGPADRELGRGAQLVVDDCSVAYGRPQNAKAASDEYGDQVVESFDCDDGAGGLDGATSSPSTVSDLGCRPTREKPAVGIGLRGPDAHEARSSS